MTPSTIPRRAAAIAVALLGVLSVLGPAYAAGQLTAQTTSATQSVTSGRFAVVATTLATAPPPGPLVLSYALGLTPAAKYFEAVNTGSLALVGASYAVVVVAPAGNPSVTLTACVGGAWNQLLGVCSGTAVALGSWSGSAGTPVATTTAPGASAARLGIQAMLSAGSLAGVTTATVHVSVSSGPTRQIRPARTTNS